VAARSRIPSSAWLHFSLSLAHVSLQVRALQRLHQRLDACRLCPNMIGPVVHGPPVVSELFLIGQAPGPREGSFGRPFAWTAGKTLFRWFDQAIGADEETVRKKVFISAVSRCFPGKAKGGGDRRPDDDEVASCRQWLEGEVKVLRPKLLLPVGSMAIEQVLQQKGPLKDFVGKTLQRAFLGSEVDIICLPHPSGASTWHRMEPGIGLLQQALGLVAKHPAVIRAFGLPPLRNATRR
jgi:uracil-DNA glycosylase